MIKKYADYEDYLDNKDKVDDMKKAGAEFVKKKDMVKVCIGGTLIVYGVITIILPTGSIPAIIFGMALMANGGVHPKKIKDNIYWHFKTKRKMRLNR